VPVQSFARSENNEWLDALMPENVLWINASVARDHGLKDGAEVILENTDGARCLPIRVKVTEGIRPDSVFMAHGYGSRSRALHRAFRKGASDTDLITRVQVDPLMGGTGMRVNFVRIINGALRNGD